MGVATVYRAQILCAMRLAMADRTNFIVQMVGMLINDGFVLLMWFMFFSGFERIGGWRMTDVALLLGIVTVVVGGVSVLAGGHRDLAARILSGEIDALLTQPQPVLPRLLASESIAHGFGDIFVGVALLTAFAGLRPRDLPLLAVAITVGWTILLSASVAFGSLAFWVRGARSFSRDLLEFLILLASYPGSIWSGPMKVIVYTLLPAGFVVLFPVGVLRAPSLEGAFILVASASAYAALALFLFHLGLRRYRRAERVS